MTAAHVALCGVRLPRFSNSRRPMSGDLCSSFRQKDFTTLTPTVRGTM